MQDAGSEGSGVASAQASGRAEQFLGFRVGEERHYRLGPVESLNLGESASWTIRLDRVAGDPPVGVFALAHERSNPVPSTFLSNPPRSDYDDPVFANLTGEARIDHLGFPEMVELRGERRFRRRAQRLALRHEFRDGAYHVEPAEPDQELAIELPRDVAGSASPRGNLFLFVPTGLRCLGRGNLTQEILDRYRLTVPCATAEPMFANPALLELAVRALDERVDGRELWFMMPNGPPAWERTLQRRGPGRSRASRTTQATWPEDPARDESRYYARAGFRWRGEQEIAVGERRVLARTLDVRDVDSVERVHFDDRGRVVRLDLTDHPVSRRPRWIRLLSAAEY